MAETQKEGYVNLKNIHGLQISGAIQGALKELRSARSFAEQLARDVSDRKREFSQKHDEETLKQAPSQVEEIKEKIEEPVEKVSKIEEVPEIVEVEEASPKPEKKIQYTDSRSFNSNSQSRGNAPRFAQNPGYNNQNRPYGQNSFQRDGNRPQFSRDGNRPYNPNGTRQFNNNQNNNGQGQRPYNPNGPRPYNPNGPRPYNPNGPRPFTPYSQNGQRPFSPRPQNASSAFASSRGNSFRSFEPLESASVLAEPERNFGNKNKNPNKNTNQDDRKQGFVKKNNNRNNIIIEDDEGFSETTMGSRKLIKAKKKEEVVVHQVVDHAVLTSEEVTVKTLSEKTGRPVTEIIKKLMMLGVMATINSVINFDTAELVASDFGVTLEKKVEQTYEEKFSEVLKHNLSKDKNATKRPPIVTVMGHVDHGKTSLLDAIRNTQVVSREAGGITQHIGAYQVKHNGNPITFIDTPGHAAFTAMRARGANITDVAILVVAADDGIMPQTIEAINHINAAHVPMIVAINKIDKPESNIERVKQQLAENGVLPEEWGGDAVLVPVSAKTGKGIDELLSMILLVSDMQELKANKSELATGIVLEASLDKNKGPLATVLVKNGTLKPGDTFVCGLTYGKVRAMFDENGKTMKTAGPSCPVCILGFDEVPNAGDMCAVIDEKFSKKVIEERKTKIKLEKAMSTSGVSLDDFMTKVNEGKLKSLNIIIKADVQGSVEALKSTLSGITNEEARVVPIHCGAGSVTESDILLASASGAVIIAFNVKTQPKAKQMAEQMKIEIKEYNIIYQAVDDLTLAINGMLTPVYEDVTTGHAEVRVVFKLSSGTVAGSYMTDGKATRNCHARVIRSGEVLGETVVDSLKILKDDKAEVMKGFEFGAKLKDNFGIKEGDTIEFFEKILVKRGVKK